MGLVCFAGFFFYALITPKYFLSLYGDLKNRSLPKGLQGKERKMATIQYQFADGHYEDIEVTEEFKEEYEFLLIREKAQHWKEMKQKERAGLRCVKDLSLDKFGEDGYDLPSEKIDPLEAIIQKENRQEQYKKIFSCLTEKQRQVYILFHIKGYKKVQIAVILHISEKAVRKRLIAAHKKIQKNF